MKAYPISVLACVLLLSMNLNGAPVKIIETEASITLSRDSKPLLIYNKGIQRPPEGMDPIYARSGYIHPVFTPSGQMVTGDFSEDHPHQHGIFMAWVDTEFRGQKVDFWNQHRNLGRVEHGRVIETKESADGRASFTVSLNHIALLGGNDVNVLEETWKVTAYPSLGDAIVFDIESHQRLVVDEALTLNEYRYGGMAIRGSNQWTQTKANPHGTCDFLTSEGLTRIDGNHTKARWVSMSGKVNGNHASIAVLDHPSNFRSPQTARIHNKMPYFVYAPVVEGSFTLRPGQIYSSLYRYLVTSDAPEPQWLDQQWRLFSQP